MIIIILSAVLQWLALFGLYYALTTGPLWAVPLSLVTYACAVVAIFLAPTKS